MVLGADDDRSDAVPDHHTGHRAERGRRRDTDDSVGDQQIDRECSWV